MKLHTVFITYNRLELTKRAIETYLETVSVPFTFSVEDNGSTDRTPEWLEHMSEQWPLGCSICRHKENWYPGRATNHGWEFGVLHSDDVTHLHRADNDYGFLPGWCEEVARKFRRADIGQVGLRTNEQEPGAPYNVGGNCVIRRELWDKGLRYDETPWPDLPEGFSEDSFFSPQVRKMGYEWTRVNKTCIYELEAVYESTNTDPYYEASWGDRHLYGRTPH